MADNWDLKQGLACLLEALDHPQWDKEERDIVEALLREHPGSASPAAHAA